MGDSGRLLGFTFFDLLHVILQTIVPLTECIIFEVELRARKAIGLYRKQKCAVARTMANPAKTSLTNNAILIGCSKSPSVTALTANRD